jgi:hypothetical protein
MASLERQKYKIVTIAQIKDAAALIKDAAALTFKRYRL